MLPTTAIIPDALGRAAPTLDLGLTGLLALALVLVLLVGLVRGAAGELRAARRKQSRRRTDAPLLPVAPRAAA